MLTGRGAMSEQPSHTIHAQQALEFADVFAYKFKGRKVGNPPRHLRLNEPDGPSTAGGRQARQSMVLVNDQGDTLVMGWVDMANKTGELRAFSYVATQFHDRKGHVIDVAQADYDGLLAEVESFLRGHKVDVHRSDRAPSQASGVRPQPAAASGGRGMGVWLAIAAGIVLGVVLGYIVFG